MSDKPTSTGELDGKTLGQYKIERQLGQGGMATVYLATQASIGRTVAIKVMPMHFMHDPSFLQRFEREVQVIAKLQHPRILPVYDYGQLENRPYIVMAYMTGGTLADLMEKGPISLDLVMKLVDQIAEGLDHAHHEGIIHRDFKPSNVLLDRSNNAHLADFGIAKISESTVALTGSGVVGTPAYMAPEMASEGIVTPSVDIYALGVTLYQMLTGKYPFSGDTPLRVMMAHATEPVPDILVMRPDLPASIAEVIRRSMAKDPMDRYPTAGELAQALRDAMAGKALPAAAKPMTAEKTVLENVQPQRAPTPTPPPAFTPPPPGGQYVVPQQSTPPPYTPPPGSTPYPYAAPVQEKKGGCSPFAIIASVIGGILVLACLGVAVATGGLGMLAAFTATETPIPTNTSAPTDTPEPNDTEAPTPTAEQASGPIVFLNDTGDTVCYIYVTENGAAGWGADRLGTQETIPDGEEVSLSIFTGTYDIKIEDCDFNVIDWVMDVELEEGGSLSLTGYNATLEIENNSGENICEVYISDPGASNWGRNLLSDNNPIDDGEIRAFAHPSGTWDLRAVTCDGRAAERDDEPLSGINTWTITD